MSPIPVCCTAEIPTSAIEKLLSEAHRGQNELVPNSPRSLAIVTQVQNGIAIVPEAPSEPPVQSFTSPFVGMSADEVASHLPKTWHFALFDKTDESVVLVQRNLKDGNQPVKTVRVAFEQAQLALVSLDVGSIGFGELQAAADAAGGLYRTPTQAPRKGGTAPRKRLGID